MRIFVQYARQTPQDWLSIDPHANPNAWRNVPKKPKPNPPGQPANLNNQNGWISDLNVQGVQFAGADAYAIEPLADGAVRITVIHEDVPPGDEQAAVWTIAPLAPDPRFGGRLNTRQSCVRYLGPAALTRFGSETVENTTVLPWSAFVRPDESLIRYGVLMTDQQFAAHGARQTFHPWTDWMEG